MIKVTLISSKGCFHFSNGHVNYEECWIYVGPAYWKNGYPIIDRYKKNWIVSRFVWFILTGRDWYSREVHHKCKIRACCNPFHLEELTKTKHRRWHSKER